MRLTSAIVVLLAIAVVVWLLTKGDGKDSGKVGPKIVNQQELADLQKSVGHQIYWVGPRPGEQYELTKLSNGRIYIRYLPAGVQAGDTRPAFLSVATYPYPNAFGTLRTLSKKQGSVSTHVQGGIAVSPGNRRQSVYLAVPGQDFEIEVYDPSARRARKTAFSGQVQPVE